MLYCRLNPVKGSEEDTDIQEQDRIVFGDVHYQVLFPGDEGGEGDHLKVYLKRDGVKGD